MVASVALRSGRPVYALPVDLFRALVGLLSAAYFSHLLLESADISSPTGLIDHVLVRELFWYTRLSLFHPGMSAAHFQLIFAAAVLASLCLAAGFRPKLMAAFMFVVAVSAYRWNFIVIYVDDAIMHLAMFWMLLLPVGHTLVLSDWLRDRKLAVEKWKNVRVSGTPLYAFLVNLTLVYVAAGAWKWTSPMWREGSALYVALRTPIAWTAEIWRPGLYPLVAGADFITLILEPLFPLMFFLPVNHRIKWALLPVLIGFHAGIVATMRVPYANIACLAALPIVFRDEIMLWLRGRSMARVRETISGSRASSVLSVSFVTLLALALIGEATVPAWRAPNRDTERRNKPGAQAGFLGTQHNPLYTPLWLVGIAQSYRLFDWIDDRNFTVTYAAVERSRDGSIRSIDPRRVFPSSIRSILLQTYVHDVTWGSVPRARADELKTATMTRFASRYCRSSSEASVDVRAVVSRINREISVAPPISRSLMGFDCAGSRASMRYVRLDEDRVISFVPGTRAPATFATFRR